MSKSTDRQRPTRPRKNATAKKSRVKRPPRRTWFEATAQHDHVRVQANVPTRWLRVLLKVLVVIAIAVLIVKAPEVWQAIQAAINALPK